MAEKNNFAINLDNYVKFVNYYERTCIPFPTKLSWIL